MKTRTEKGAGCMGENSSSLLCALMPNYSWGTPKIKLSKSLYPIQLSDSASPAQEQLPQQLDIFLS